MIQNIITVNDLLSLHFPFAYACKQLGCVCNFLDSSALGPYPRILYTLYGVALPSSPSSFLINIDDESSKQLTSKHLNNTDCYE